MSAHPRVSNEDIETALRVWRGDVTNAAKDLGITKRALYERIHRMGLDLDELRSHDITFSSSGVVTSPSEASLRADSINKRVSVSQSGEYLMQDARTKFHSMAAKAGAVLENLGSEIRLRAQQPPRLLPEQVDELQALRLKVQARLGVEMSNSSLLQDMFKKCLPTYAAQWLEVDGNGKQ